MSDGRKTSGSTTLWYTVAAPHRHSKKNLPTPTSPAKTPNRPSRYPEQDDHVAVAASLSAKGGKLDEVAACMTAHCKLLPEVGKPNVFDNAFQASHGQRAARDESSTDLNTTTLNFKQSSNPGTAASGFNRSRQDKSRISLYGPMTLPGNSDFIVNSSSPPMSSAAPERHSRRGY